MFRTPWVSLYSRPFSTCISLWLFLLNKANHKISVYSLWRYVIWLHLYWLFGTILKKRSVYFHNTRYIMCCYTFIIANQMIICLLYNNKEYYIIVYWLLLPARHYTTMSSIQKIKSYTVYAVYYMFIWWHYKLCTHVVWVRKIYIDCIVSRKLVTSQSYSFPLFWSAFVDFFVFWYSEVVAGTTLLLQ